MANGEAGVTAANAQQISPAGRLIGVFTDPVKTFADIARKPGFWSPMIALIVVTVAATQAVFQKIGIEAIVRHQLEMSGRASNMTPAQMQQAVATGAKFGTIFGNVGSVIGVPIVLLILAVIGLLIMKVVFGSSPSFKAAFSVTAYAYLPRLIDAILVILVALFGDPANINPQNLSPGNLSFFMSQQSTSKALYALGGSIDIFSFWVLGLLGIGFAATASGKARPRSVFFCFLALWIIYVLIKIGLALI